MRYKILLRTASALLLLMAGAADAQVSFTLPSNPALTAVNQIEYFIDADPGFNNATPVPSFTAATDVTVNNLSVSLTGLPNGVHRLYIRSHNAANGWSLTNVQTFFIVNLNSVLPPNLSPANISRIEYFIDTDPGFGACTPLSFGSNTDVTISNVAIPLAGFKDGVHRLYVRSKDVAGSWSLTNVQVFYIANLNSIIPPNTTPGTVVKMEYFVDADPGFGAASPINFAASNDATVNNYPVTIGSLSTGVHRLYVRSQDNTGKWSLTNVQNFAVVNNITLPANTTPHNLVKLEYFFDNDPGFGNGHAVSIPATTDLQGFNFTTDLTGLSYGNHKLYVRVLDDWSLTNVLDFLYGSALPVTWLSFSGKLQGDSVLLNWQTSNEVNNASYTVERSADNERFVAIGNLAGAGTTQTTHSYRFTDYSPVKDIGYYRIKQTDANGKTSYSGTVTVRLSSGKFMVLTNPVHQTLYVQIPEAPQAGAVFLIYNATGQRVSTAPLREATTVQSVDVAALPAGNYVLMLQSKTGSQSAKFIKQ